MVNNSWIRAQPNWSGGLDGPGFRWGSQNRVFLTTGNPSLSAVWVSTATPFFTARRRVLNNHPSTSSPAGPFARNRGTGSAAIVPCFRREKGAHGDSTFDTRAIYDLVRILYDFSRLSLIHFRSQKKRYCGFVGVSPNACQALGDSSI